MTLQQLPAAIKRQIPTAKMPIQYDEACKSLAACTSIDEAKYWDDKSEALAAWARIYKSDKAALAAKRLKLHAYRRMGQLAAELRPSRRRALDGHSRGDLPGPHSLLRESGFKEHDVKSITRVANMPDEKFNRLINSPVCPSPRTLAAARVNGSESYRALMTADCTGFRAFCRRYEPAKLARELARDELPRIIELIREIQEWIDTFEQHLPKKKHE